MPFTTEQRSNEFKGTKYFLFIFQLNNSAKRLIQNIAADIKKSLNLRDINTNDKIETTIDKLKRLVKTLKNHAKS